MSLSGEAATLKSNATGIWRMSSIAAEHLVPPSPEKSQRVSRAVQFALALLLNLAFLFLLFYRVPYVLPPLSKEPKSIAVELVPPPQPAVQPAPPPPEPQPQPQEQEQAKPEAAEAYEFKGSGDVTADKAGRPLDVEAEEEAKVPEKAAEKPKADAPERVEADVPDWAKKLAKGYDLPEQRTSSSSRTRSSSNKDFSVTAEAGEGGGDEYSNQLKAQILSHTNVPIALLQHIARNTLVELTIDRRGNLQNARLIQSSGVREFDVIVLQGVLTAAPFRPLPSGTVDAITMVWGVGGKRQ